ncbi:MAG: hypothetical protein HYZ28_01555 [Myxococcales bacterium]|nr:hypothetical protein [Myxococcales bacterium]
MPRTRAAPLLIALCLACVGHRRLELIQKLSPEGRELYSKYKQFLTEGQQEEFLALPSDDERLRYVQALRIEERLSRYPKFVQDAIWSQEVVPGMDREAVLLTWSTPMLREWDQLELAKGNEVERWNYQREDGTVQVVITNGVVTQVLRGSEAR